MYTCSSVNGHLFVLWSNLNNFLTFTGVIQTVIILLELKAEQM